MLIIHCVRCEKETKAVKVGLREAVASMRTLDNAAEITTSRKGGFWNRCCSCGTLYSAPPPRR